ncbi:hypothetical protein [Novispirillum itersonii]|uniref:hypothetical protein n=1 Tax=Novispirillum itersonii TaxID=189 RepID=UPI0012DD1D41|nr:hypothetical protein [Novispirillum itersonii]
MSTIMIAKVKTITKGGMDAEITGIDPVAMREIIIGTVNQENVDWDCYGICRDNPEEYNLNIDRQEVLDVIATAKKLCNS